MNPSPGLQSAGLQFWEQSVQRRKIYQVCRLNDGPPQAVDNN